MTTKSIAHAVRYCRKQSGLSQAHLAMLAGVGKTVVFDIEKGKTTIQMDSLLKILNALNIRLTLNTPIPLPPEENK